MKGRDWQASVTDPMFVAVCALGITQITAWGTAYYCLGILANPIATDTGWSRSWVYLGFTVALLAMGFVSTSVGRAIDRYGGRAVMSVGAVLVSAGMAALSMVRDEVTWLVVWVFLGVGMRLSLYDAAFAALAQVVPSRARRAISYLTLFGAFASTVFWLIGHYLNDAFGWRQTLVWFAVINLAICLPLNWIGLSRREASAEPGEAAQAASPAPEHAPLTGRQRSIGIALFALIMSLNGFVFAVVTVQLVPLLEGAGLAAASAVWVASLKGFAQFGGRLTEIVFGRNLHAITVARITVGLLPVSFLMLYFAGGRFALILAFTLLMGACQGVVTIIRGAVPLVLFGPAGYGAVLGVIATPILIVNAASPTIFALIVDAWGWRTGEVSLIIAAVASWIAMEVMARWYERTRRRD